MLLGLDATPLLGRRTGVGRYVAGLAAGLAELDAPPDLVLAAFTWRQRGELARLGGAVTGHRVPARALQAAWLRTPWPPLEWLGVRCQVFHATNYVLPPTRRAAGVLSIHDLSYELHPDTVSRATLRYRRLVPRGLARARVVLTLTEALGAEVAAFYGLDPSRVRAARPGVDASWLATPAPEPGWGVAHGLPERYLLFVGTLEPRKNLPVLLAALRLLGPQAPPLVLAGPAGWGPAPAETGLPAGAVRRLGWVEDAVLRRVVAGAACLVFPSRHEGFGLPPLEALACGTPVVSSDLPALREVTGDCARYAAPGDPEELAAALQAELAAGSWADPAARAARRRHAAGWTWRRCAQEAMAAYAQALG